MLLLAYYFEEREQHHNQCVSYEDIVENNLYQKTRIEGTLFSVQIPCFHVRRAKAKIQLKERWGWTTLASCWKPYLLWRTRT